MTIEYYVAPVQSDIPVRGGTATVTASRVLLYLNSGVVSTSSLIPRDGSGKNWTITIVDADAATHTAIQADNQIGRLSIRADLNTAWQDLTNPQRNVITNVLANRGIETAWIVNTTTLREIINYCLGMLADTFA